jgi:hypothetical protein
MPAVRSKKETPFLAPQAGVPVARGFRAAGWRPGSPSRAVFARRGGGRGPRRARFSRGGVEAGVEAPRAAQRSAPNDDQR